MDRGREWARRALAVALLGALLVGLPASAAGRSVDALVHPGQGSFVFDGRPAFPGSPVRVYYSAPPDPASAQVLVVLHGLNRDGRAHRDDWARVLGGRNVLVLVPEFAASGYPAYNLGDVTDARGAVRGPDQWDFLMVEALFDRVVADVGGDAAAGYLLFGFSGGGQFVHRFVELMPRQRARVAVAANAGWYTMPDDALPFPHGLGGLPVQVAGLQRAFGTNLVVLLGGRDSDPRDPSLQRDPRTDRQGVQRLERGRTFFRQAAAAARARSFTFAWRVHEEPTLGHVHADAARAALPYLLGDR